MPLWLCTRHHWSVVVLADDPTQAELLADAAWAGDEGWLTEEEWVLTENGYGRYPNPLTCVVGFS